MLVAGFGASCGTTTNYKANGDTGAEENWGAHFLIKSNYNYWSGATLTWDFYKAAPGTGEYKSDCT